MQKRNMVSVSFIIAVAMIFSSCSLSVNKNVIFNGNSENYGDTGGVKLPFSVNKEEITILTESDYSDLSDKIVIKELGERTGLVINVISVPSESLYDRIKVLLSSGTLPDIMCTPLSLSEINSLGMKGTFAPVNKFLSELPNFRRIYTGESAGENVFDKYSARDGNIYNFPKYNCRRESEEGMMYRADIFEKHNIPLWNNQETFYNALKKLKEIYPDCVPFIIKDNERILDKLSPGFGIDFPNVFYDSDSNMWCYSGTDIRFKAMLDFIRKLYQEKLINDNFLTTNEDIWKAKMLSDNSFVTYGNIRYMDLFCNQKQGDYDLQYASLPGNYKKVRKTPVVEIGPVVSANSNKLLSMKLLDYLLSPSGAELMTLGVLNKTYNYNNDDVKYLGFSLNEIVTTDMVEEKYGLFINGLFLTSDRRSPCYLYSEREEKAIEEVPKKEDIFGIRESSISMSPEDKERTEEILTNLSPKAYEFAKKYITSSNIDDLEFEKWIISANNYGAEEMIKIYNKY